jgi:hypothetical protein
MKEQQLKKCPRCKSLVLPNNFKRLVPRPDGKYPYHPVCQECQSVPKQIIVEMATRMKKISRFPNLTLEEYLKKKEETNGNCEICGVHKPDKKLCLDHNHKNGHFRGLLCNSCNSGLGLFKDSTQLLKKAAEYLECKP